MISGYRLAAGTLTVATLDESYAIESLPVQSDMSGFGWAAPNKGGGSIVPAAVVTDLTGARANYGLEELKWRLPWVTPGMVSYLYTTPFGGSPSAIWTIRDYDEQTASWRVLNCTAHWATPDEIRQLRWFRKSWSETLGCENFPITFIKCEDAAAS